MKITDLDIKEFCSILKDFKEEVSKDLGEWKEEGDHIHVMLNSIDILIKELKGVTNLDSLSLERKKNLFPHITYVYNYMNYIVNEEGSFDEDYLDDFDDEWLDDDEDIVDEDDEDEDEDEEDEEDDEENEIVEVKPAKKITVSPKKMNDCCEGSTCKTTGKPKKK
jgi:hypothetical protein